MTRRELLGSTLSAATNRNGRYLARAVATVRTHGWTGALPDIDRADREARIRLEEDNVIQCLNYAREKLGMGT